MSRQLINQDEAWQLQQTISDLPSRQIVASALTQAVMFFSQAKTPPACDFDLRFFTEIMIRLSQKQAYLKAILNGEDLRWWPE